MHDPLLFTYFQNNKKALLSDCFVVIENKKAVFSIPIVG